MKCSFEIPIAHAKELKEHQEYDFTLAHLWLSSQQYREAYAYGSVMDNGQYELGEPLPIKELRRAATLARPSVVIAPDWLDNVQATKDAFKEASLALDCEVACCIVGRSTQEQMDMYKWACDQSIEIVCLPFRTPRLELLGILNVQNQLDKDRWHHFLGLQDMNELKSLKTLGLKYASIDTSKPIKAAIHGLTIYDNLRGLGHIDMEAQYEREVVEKMRFQMDRFREEAQA